MARAWSALIRSAVSDLAIGSVFDSAEFAGAVDDGADEIGVVVRDFALQDRGDALESHAGIDGRTRQRRHGAGRIAIELHEDEIPDFGEAAAAIEGEFFVLAAGLGGFGSEIVEDLGAGAAGTGVAHLPEVVLFIEAENADFGDAGDFLPEKLGFVVFAEDGDVELVFREAVVFRDEVPGELDGFGFEVVAEGEIAEHLEEGVMAAGVADVFEIVVLAAGADAFLGRGGAGVVAGFETLEDLFELVHAGVGEEQGGVVGRQEGAAADDAVPAGVEEVEKTLTDVVAGHRSPFYGWIVRL